ncbi:hypothetical protein PO124_21860 [Bacillus licheniformis]|nr:hypothetical protein [Bacillus licheniformis]
MASLKEIVIHVEQSEDYTFIYLVMTGIISFLREMKWKGICFSGTNRLLRNISRGSRFRYPCGSAVPVDGGRISRQNSFNSFSDIILTEETEPLMKTASTIYEFIADEDFLPDYEAWKQEMLRWKDKEGIWKAIQPNGFTRCRRLHQLQ